MNQIIACDQDFQLTENGFIVCPGTIVNYDMTFNAHPQLTNDDFGVLALGIILTFVTAWGVKMVIKTMTGAK